MPFTPADVLLGSGYVLAQGAGLSPGFASLLAPSIHVLFQSSNSSDIFWLELQRAIQHEVFHYSNGTGGNTGLNGFVSLDLTLSCWVL